MKDDGRKERAISSDVSATHAAPQLSQTVHPTQSCVPPPLKSVTHITAAPSRLPLRDPGKLGLATQPFLREANLITRDRHLVPVPQEPRRTPLVKPARVPVHSQSPPFRASGLPASTPRLALTTVLLRLAPGGNS